MILEAKNISKTNYFNNLSLQISEGTITNIVSKSFKPLDILSKAFIGLIAVKGDIKLFNHDSKKALTKAKEFIGYASTLKYKNNMTAKQYLILTAKFYKLNLNERINHLLDRFKINPDTKIESLTEFEKLDLSIIKAIIHNPKLVILNNICEHLDSRSIETLKGIMVEMKKDNAAFIITSTHYMFDICDNVYFLNESLKEFNSLKTTYKIEISASSFASLDLKGISLLNVHKNDDIVSFIILDRLTEVLKYIASLKPNYINITHPYVGEVFDESLPTI